ncbi:MAG: ferrous iron transport protein A [Armatimonadetes bacterium]|nr:ferrous iron transport protein A [Armatimonadota bacterium]
MTLLSVLKPGERGRIVKIAAKGPLKRRLMDMGILVGEEVRMEKIAPLGDPLEIRVKNYNLSFRKKEAEEITVEALQ